MYIYSYTHNYPRSEEDFIGGFIRNLYWGLGKYCDRRFTVFAPVSDSTLWQSGVERVRYLFSDNDPLFYQPIANKKLSPRNLLQLKSYCDNSVKQSLEFMKHGKPDLLHGHWLFPGGYIASKVSRLTGVPYMVTLYGTDLSYIRNNWFLKRIAKKILLNATVIHCISEYTVGLLRDILPDKNGEYSTKLRVVYYPYDDRKFSDDMYSLDERSKVIFAFGRMVARKGFQHLVKAFKSLKNRNGYKLVITGRGPMLEFLRDYDPDICIQEERVNTIPALKWAKIFVMPSVVKDNDTEGQGLALAEAAASGCYCISTDAGGLAETAFRLGVDTVSWEPENTLYQRLAERIDRAMSVKIKPKYNCDYFSIKNRALQFDKEVLGAVYAGREGKEIKSRGAQERLERRKARRLRIWDVEKDGLEAESRKET